MRLRLSYIFLALSLVTFVVFIAATSINHRGARYNGRTLGEWLQSPTNQASIQAFKKAGTSSFPFLLQQLNGSGRTAACTVIWAAFQGSQIENSEIEARLRRMLTDGHQGEQLEAYSIIRKLDLNVPDSEIALAAKTCPAIKASEDDLNAHSKLTRLFSMTNSIDYGFIAQLCNDPDPQVQMLTLGFMGRMERTKNKDLCNDEIIRALAKLIRNTKDPSVVRSALAYISEKPQRIHDNLDAVCSLLERTSNSSLQSECISLLESLHPSESLPAEVRVSLEQLHRTGTDAKVRREAGDLLAFRSN